MNKKFTTIEYNPWPGPLSYQDPQSCEHSQDFCGREKEIIELTHLIDEYFFVTLYGMSGIGKSSLLNAGVFPKLREMQYLPISIRLLLVQNGDNFQRHIINCIELTITNIGGRIKSVNIVEEATDITKDDYLWNYFARHSFYDKEGNVLFPVIVLDQFEEVLRSNELRLHAETLLSQIAYLINENNIIDDCIVDGEEYSYDFNYRFVLSIREDDLYRLEDSIDKSYLVSLKQNRYRLRGMNRINAESVITIPSKGIITNQETTSILKDLKESRDENIDIWNPAILSLFLYLYYEKDGEADPSNVFADYYHNATSSQFISETSLTYLEDHLLTDAGHRNLMLLSEAQDTISTKSLNNLIASKIIQVDKRNGVDYIEFSHDRLCAEAKKNREQRNLRMQKKKFYNRIIVISLISAFICLVVSFYYLRLNENKKELQAQYDKLRETNQKLDSRNEELEKTKMELSETIMHLEQEKIYSRAKSDTLKVVQKENTKKDKQIAEQNLQIAELNLIIAKMTTESENQNKNRSGIFSSKDMYPNESPTQTTDNYDGIMNMTKEQMEELINNKKQ